MEKLKQLPMTCPRCHADGFEKDKPDTPEKVHEMICDILDEKRYLCIHKLAVIGMDDHPIWTD